jgi:hypothetical protein
MQDEEELINPKLKFLVIISFYIFYVISTVYVNKIYLFFEEIITYSGSSKKILIIPLIYAMIIAIKEVAIYITNMFVNVKFIIGIFISIIISLFFAYLGSYILNPQYHPYYKDLYIAFTFMISATAPYFFIIIREIFSNQNE